MSSDDILEPTRVLYKNSRGKYKAYNDNSQNLLKGKTMIKKVTTIIKHNRKEIQKRAIVIGGTALGAFIAGVIVAKAEEPLEGLIVVEEQVPDEDPTIEETPEEK